MGTGWARASLPRCAFQVDELERKVKSQQDQLFLTRQELTNTSAELKMRAMQAEGGRTQACDRGAGQRSPGAGADGEPRAQGAPGDPLCAFPWASRAPGTGEEEVPAEPGGLGAAALQRGASIWSLPPHCPPGAFAHLSVARQPLTSLWVPGGSSPPAPGPRPRTPAALGLWRRLPCASCHSACGTGMCPRSHLRQPLGRNGVPKICLPPRVRIP